MIVSEGKLKKWRLTGNKKRDLRLLVNYLRKSPTGKKLLKKAEKRALEYGNRLMDSLEIGQGSITDTTLIRRFPAHNPGKIEYEHKAKVVINGELPLIDAVLDLAHELTHFTYRMTFNPYEGKYDPSGFIQKTIEGRGGEVDAFLVECKVFRELRPDEFRNRSNCRNILHKKTGRLSRRVAIRNFYKIGPHFRTFRKELSEVIRDKKMPPLTQDDPAFISSAYGVPYPVAAMREYFAVLSRVCANDERRLEIMRQGLGRAPAADNSRQKLFKRLKNSFLDRCMSIM